MALGLLALGMYISYFLCRFHLSLVVNAKPVSSGISALEFCFSKAVFPKIYHTHAPFKVISAILLLQHLRSISSSLTYDYWIYVCFYSSIFSLPASPYRPEMTDGSRRLPTEADVCRVRPIKDSLSGVYTFRC